MRVDVVGRLESVRRASLMKVYVVQDQNNEIVKIVDNREKAIELIEEGYVE